MNSNFFNPQITNKLKDESKSYDDYVCLLKFKFCDKKYPLEKLNNKELKSLLKFFQKIEEYTWNHIKYEDKSLNYEIIKDIKVPDNIPNDATIVSLRVADKFRIIGFRSKANLYIIWFDKNHEVY